MKENTFLEKFQHKTDSELEYIVKNKKSYNEKAVAASILILKNRNGESPELEFIENEIKIEKERKIITHNKSLEEEKKKTTITDDPNAHELYSKKVIIGFSGIFSTIFGAVLLMYNMKQTNNKKGRTQVLIFGVLYTIITLLIVNSINTVSNMALPLNIAGGMILNEYFWNTFIGKEMKHRKRNWVKPAIISVLITIPFVLAMIYAG